jgi:hypothetical protein
LDVALAQSFHQGARRFGAFGCNQQVHVVGHQHIGMNAAACLVGVPGQSVQVVAVIFVGEEAGLPVIAALDDVERDVG